MNVLLLSPSPLLAEHVREILDPAGHALTVLHDAADLEERLDSARPEVVLIAAPDGAELCSAVYGHLGPTQEGSSAPRVVLLSPDQGDAEAAGNAGALFLGLPFQAPELLVTLTVASRAKKLILLCDDSTLIHRHTVPILTEAGYEVCAAYDGEEGLHLAQSRRPDLVITDVEMPHLDGYALCRALKASYPRLPVIICSALGEAQDVERGFDAGADDYLVKPAQPDDMLSRVQVLLGIGRGLPSRERVLVVDDSPAIRHLIAESLRRQGFAVMTASDGEAGLLAARAERPAMVITDYDMPRMTGFEMVHALKQDPRTRTIPILMLTARNTKRDQAQMRAIGLNAYLVKPFVVDKCVAMVERILAEERLRAYKIASRLYISDATVRAAEEVARSGDLQSARATEQVVAVLFSDICGFTSLSSQRSPREVVDLLNGCFDALCPVIREEGGDIDKFIGDAIMAIFDDRPGEARPGPLRAVRAALRMQEALRRWNQATGGDLSIRVGVNTGPVVRGDIGSRYVRRDYTVIGDVVNRAQRFESNAPPGGVLMGETAYQAVREHVRCEARPPIQLKGLKDPVRAYVALALLDGGEPER